MRQLSFLLLAAASTVAATPIRDYRTLFDEPAPTSLPVPVVGVRESQIRDTWGDARSEGRTHEGVDIFARRGTPVISTTHGYISSIQVRARGGNTVSVQGPGGHRHYYAHLDAYGRHREGEWVEAGDTLGFVGTTGNAQGTSPHLHYGIYTSEGPINPYPLLASSSANIDQKRAPSNDAPQKTTSRRGERSVDSDAGRNSRVETTTTAPGTGTPAVARRRR